ncbi:MAG: type II toxin-antitoxin system Phd/YefM family antitoxin [Verrucomicrobia bacterium]|nr:type II toxin-antitoxin system Phd/YefM family antitoxin [Verrucomicrobiota bacterium]MCH8511274.1 type II toxin-antitoxin system Phd/YefM family antitoxin [Kiritimatiellia bacterium]
MKTSSVSSLKNHLSARLKQVVAGESFLITDRNRAVAVLSPLVDGNLDARLEGLTAEGLVRPGSRKLDLQAFLSLSKGRCEAPLSGAIQEDREGR